MNRKLLLQEVADTFALRANISKKKAEAFCRAFFDLIEEELTHESFVKIKGFGIFKVITVNDRESININTGERFRIDSHSRLSFVPDSQLKDLINKSFADFQTITLQDETTDEELTKAEAKIGQEISTTQSPIRESIHNLEQKPQNKIENNLHKKESADSSDLQEENSFFHNERIEQEKEITGSPIQNLEYKELHKIEIVTPPHTPTQTPSSQPIAIEPNKPEQPLKDSQALSQENEEEVRNVNQPDDQEAESSSQDNLPQRKRFLVKCFFISSIFILQSTFCYYAGYYRWFCPCEKAEQKSKPVDGKTKTVVTTYSSSQMKAEKVENRNQRINTTTEADTINYDNVYPQLPNGRFQIIGTLSIHELKKGEIIYHLAKDIYGDKSYAIYIFTFNQLKNPDLVPIGTKLKLPKLRKRTIKK